MIYKIFLVFKNNNNAFYSIKVPQHATIKTMEHWGQSDRCKWLWKQTNFNTKHTY